MEIPQVISCSKKSSRSGSDKFSSALNLHIFCSRFLSSTFFIGYRSFIRLVLIMTEKHWQNISLGKKKGFVCRVRCWERRLISKILQSYPNLNKQETQPTTDANSLKFSVYTKNVNVCVHLKSPWGKRTKDLSFVAINFWFNAAKYWHFTSSLGISYSLTF